MRTRRLRPALRAPVCALVLPACALALSACGGSGAASSPVSISQLPLVKGSSVVSEARQCDQGANAFCAVEAVVVGRRFESSGALLVAERHQLRSLGWSATAGDFGKEQAAESPGRKLRVTYATAAGDLLGWDEGWIKRPKPIAVTLSRTMILGMPAISVMLEAGSA